MVTLYTAGTPNGRKASIMLEEVGVAYTVKALDFSKNEQKSDAFTQVNPNGRIPAIVDHDNGDFAVFESGAILHYLAEKTGKFWPKDMKARSVVLQWLMFQMAGVGPMQGQASHFSRYAPEKVPYAIDRYKNETRRLYTILDKRLASVSYLAGDYSIADMATYPWVAAANYVGIDASGLPHLDKWIERVGSRPAVKKGMEVPAPAA